MYIQKYVAWDPPKAIRNREKHGVSFEEASTVLLDTNALDWDDVGHSSMEERRKRVGTSIQQRIVLVVYTTRRTSDGQETIRIISARQASRKEREAYPR